MNKEELGTILNLHYEWLRGDTKGVRADLSNADLSNANLSNADLSSANLSYADLSYADLSYANLSNANLSNASLSYASLSYADLSNANLPSNGMLLLSFWRNLSPELCKIAMVYDCINLENGPELFQQWKDTGKCPYKNSKTSREINFVEDKALWENSLIETHQKSAREIVQMLIKEKCKNAS